VDNNKQSYFTFIEQNASVSKIRLKFYNFVLKNHDIDTGSLLKRLKREYFFLEKLALLTIVASYLILVWEA
jgi:hypothetical protein